MKKIETEVKFIIEKPSLDMLHKMKDYTESEILQIYLESEKLTHRVRRRKYSDGHIEYTENTKERISIVSSIETEKEITEEEFYRLSQNIEKGSKPLEKVRRTFYYSGHTIELDYYNAWKNTCIMEVELDDEREKIDYPSEFNILLNATGDRRYSNHSMARSFPEEYSK